MKKKPSSEIIKKVKSSRRGGTKTIDASDEVGQGSKEVDEALHALWPTRYDSDKDEDGAVQNWDSDGDGREDNIPDVVHERLVKTVRKVVRRTSVEQDEKVHENDDDEHNDANQKRLEKRVTLGEMVQALNEMPNFGELKRKLEQMETRGKPVDTPLDRPAAEKVDREAAYGHASREVTKWQNLVKKNREAATLSFPIRDGPRPGRNEPSVGQMTSTFSPMNKFEEEIDEILRKNGVLTERDVASGEDLQMQKLSEEEVISRRRELAKMRSLLFFHERKLKRVKKIKSKKFRRIHRNEKAKVNAMNGIQDLDDDVAAALQREKARAEERMSLRHKNTSKWIKRKLSRGEARFVAGTRSAIEDQLRKGEELRAKIASTGESDESEDSDAGKEIDGQSEQEPEFPERGIFGLPFMKRALQRKKLDVERETRELEDHSDPDRSDPINAVPTPSSRRKFNPTRDQQEAASRVGSALDGEVDEGSNGSDNDEEGALQRAVKSNGKRARGDKTNSIPIGYNEEPRIGGFVTRAPGMVIENRNRDINPIPPADGGQEGGGRASPNVWMQPAKRRDAGSEKLVSKIAGMGKQLAHAPKGHHDQEDIQDNMALVREAFEGAGDEKAEFDKLKEETLAKELPQASDLGMAEALPGWGSWSGVGVRPSRGSIAYAARQQQKLQEARTAALKRRRDAAMSHVILNEKRLKGASHLTVPAVPHPFRTRELYEASLAMPLGKEWQTSSSFRRNIVPEVRVRAGAVIDPIRLMGAKSKRWEQSRRPLAS